MSKARKLSPDQLRTHCDPDSLGIATTADAHGQRTGFGQNRALDATRLGLGIEHPGYNVFAMGPPGLGKRVSMQTILEVRAGNEPTPPDWCYVHNFARPDQPHALQLPAGLGKALADDTYDLVESLRAAVPTAFESEEFQNRLQEIEDDVRENRESAMEAVAEQASADGARLVQTPAGVAFAPVRDGEIIRPEAFAELSDEEQASTKEKIEKLQELAQNAMREATRFSEGAYKRVKDLNEEIAQAVVDKTISAMRKRWADHEPVTTYLDDVAADMIENADEFRPAAEVPIPLAAMALLAAQSTAESNRYSINLLIDRQEDSGAPVIYEDHPTYQNLVGRVEYRSHFGALETDFTLIKPGALHRANGGYLILDARKLLLQPYAWEGLKSALRTRTLRIESLAEALSLVSTATLQPQEIPLKVKIVLIGDRQLYYMLHEYDPEFSELFKISADFEESVARSAESISSCVTAIAATIREQDLRPFDKTAVARIIDASTREAGDSEKISLHDAWMQDLIRESDYVAASANRTVTIAEDVDRAVALRIERSDRVRSQVYEAIERETIQIDTQGEEIGQVNGLSVLAIGNFAFGQPSRITATARLGQGRVVDIEREVDLGGSHHSKGVLILSNFLADRYARERPLALAASLVFEQSYGRVDGDSASTAELCALLSALAQVRLKQSIAITGAVNQKGEVQAIGGVNEKIEGFFDICRLRGLTGDQGVIIPQANVKHLTLRDDVTEEVRAGRFHVYAVDNADAALELLTGMQAGERTDTGAYPEGSVNRLIEDRLEHFHQLRRREHAPPTEDPTEDRTNDGHANETQ